MTFTFSGALDTNLERVRHLIQDMDVNHPLLQDEEIDFHLNNSTNVFLAASACCLALAAKYGRMIDRSAISVSDSPNQPASFYLELSDNLKQQAYSSIGVEIFAGGLSSAGKATNAEDTDLVQPGFAVGMDDPQ